MRYGAIASGAKHPLDRSRDTHKNSTLARASAGQRRRITMAKGQMRSSKEKRKPKKNADEKKKK